MHALPWAFRELPAGRALPPPQPLFRKLDDDELAGLVERLDEETVVTGEPSAERDGTGRRRTQDGRICADDGVGREVENCRSRMVRGAAVSATRITMIREPHHSEDVKSYLIEGSRDVAVLDTGPAPAISPVSLLRYRRGVPACCRRTRTGTTSAPVIVSTTCWSIRPKPTAPRRASAQSDTSRDFSPRA